MRAFTVVFALLAASVLGAQAPASEDAVRAAEFARRRALLAADTVTLSRLTAPEFYEISRLGTVRTRATNLQEIATGALKLTSITFDSLVVQVYGNTAVLSGITDNTGEFRGTPFAGKVRYMRIFVQRDGRWQAVAMQHTPIQ